MIVFIRYVIDNDILMEVNGNLNFFFNKFMNYKKIMKIFGTWENLEKHWAKVEKEIEEEIEKHYHRSIYLSIADMNIS